MLTVLHEENGTRCFSALIILHSDFVHLLWMKSHIHGFECFIYLFFIKSLLSKHVTGILMQPVQSQLRWAVLRWPRHQEAELQARRARSQWPTATQGRRMTSTRLPSTCGWRMKRNITDRWAHCLRWVAFETQMPFQNKGSFSVVCGAYGEPLLV